MRAKGEGTGPFYSESKGLWIARVELPPGPNGKRRRPEVSGKSKAEVIRKKRALLREKETHGDLPTSSWTVTQWGDYWLAHTINGTRMPNTARNYESRLRNHVYPTIGSVRLSKLTAAHIRRVIEHAQDANGKDSPSLSVLHATVHLMFRDAVREHYMVYNPCDDVPVPRVRPPKVNPMSPAKTREVLQTLMTGPDAALWTLYVVTGARRAEIAGLTWDRVDAERLDLYWQLSRLASRYDVPADKEVVQIRGGLYLCPPKSVAGRRIIPNVEPISTVINAWRAVAPANRWNLVFTRIDRTGKPIPLEPNYISDRWRDKCKELGLGRVRLHDLRHGAVDLLYSLGVPERIIIEIVGHSAYAMSRSYKSLEDYGPRREAMKSLGEYLAPVTKPLESGGDDTP